MTKKRLFHLFSLMLWGCSQSSGGGGACVQSVGTGGLSPSRQIWKSVYLEWLVEPLSSEALAKPGRIPSQWLREGFMSLSPSGFEFYIWMKPVSIPWNQVHQLVLHWPTESGWVPLEVLWPPFEESVKLSQSLSSVFGEMLSLQDKGVLNMIFAGEQGWPNIAVCHNSDPNKLCGLWGGWFVFRVKPKLTTIPFIKQSLIPPQSSEFLNFKKLIDEYQQFLSGMARLEFWLNIKKCQSGEKDNFCVRAQTLLSKWSDVSPVITPYIPTQYQQASLTDLKKFFYNALAHLQDRQRKIVEFLKRSPSDSWVYQPFVTFQSMGFNLKPFSEWSQSGWKWIDLGTHWFMEAVNREGFIWDRVRVLPLLTLFQDYRNESGGFVLNPVPVANGNDFVGPPPSCP